MVIPDLSAPEAISRNSKTSESMSLAPAMDRFIAFIIDFLIFSPVISLFVASLTKKIKLGLILESSSTELAALWFVLGFLVVVMTVVLQALFVFFWHGTPGQKFMQIRVVTFPEQAKDLTFAQALLRSFCWALSFVFFGVPFVEILGHAQRRAFHERASDTLTVSLKNLEDNRPLEIETRFISGWLGVFFFAISTFAVGFVWKTWESIRVGGFKDESAVVSLCEAIPGGTGTLQRMDQAIALYLNKSLTAECLHREAEFALWQVHDLELTAWAYWAKSLIETDSSYQKRYQDMACSSEVTSTPCQLSLVVNETTSKNPVEVLEALPNSVTARLLMVDQLLAQRLLLKAHAVVQELKTQQILPEVTERKFVKLSFMLAAESSRKKSLQERQPASVESEQVLQQFKREYDIP